MKSLCTKYLGIVIVVSLFATSSHGASQPRSVVVMFGDSISVGYNSLRQTRNGDGRTDLGGPTEFLSDRLNNKDERRPSTVVNWGEGGTSSARGVQRISSNLASVRTTYPEDRCFVLLMYGTNDFGFGINSSTTTFNTRVMIQSIRSSGCTPIVGNLTPRSDRDLSSLSRSVTSIARSENALLVDQFSTFIQRPLVYNFELERSRITGEFLRLHPNEAGYRLLVRNWFGSALVGLITPLEPVPTIVPILQLLLDD